MYDAKTGWYEIRHLEAEAGDIKDVWEPGRFGWAYDLMRGWMLTRDDVYAAAFWRNFECFMAGCPMFCGVQWSCGQEAAIRAIAWLWAEAIFSEAPSSTSDRVVALRRAVGNSAARIGNAIGYAMSQRNNHGISEATGLVTIGMRFRESPVARGWVKRGVEALVRLMEDQIADDGWYIQHSTNYTRLMLDQLIMATFILRSAGEGLPKPAMERIRTAVRLLAAVCDRRTGVPPNHGANDGANALPLSLNSYRDFRPTLTAAASLFDVELPVGLAPQMEPLAWLRLPLPAFSSTPKHPAISTGRSGWIVGETAGARIFARAGEYHSRPSHIDPLHVDIWIDGRPVAVDAGTYRYMAPPPWRDGLACIDVHNTLTLSGYPPAERGPRFLWLRWPNATVRSAIAVHEELRIELENLSWTELGIRHLRFCLVRASGVTVVDDVRSDQPRGIQARVQWLLTGDSHDVMVRSDQQVEIEESRGQPDEMYGWVSERYSEKEPATSVRILATLHRKRVLIVSGFGDHRAETHLLALLAACERGSPFALNQGAD
ncbi:MAG: heparinase II/III family protein [Gemmatimonadaceae bacterium]